MTIWDDVYKNHQRGGEAWASLSEDIHPAFKGFLGQANFKHKHVLDIGCGTGKYLKILQVGGFETDGIDSSKAAVEITKKLLGDDPQIICQDMFSVTLPCARYDLIISLSTIQHGTKPQAQKLINEIYQALTQNGKVFITVPDIASSKKWHTFKNHKKITEGTIIPLSGPEKGLTHSFYTKKELQKMFAKFKKVELELDDRGRWVIRASK